MKGDLWGMKVNTTKTRKVYADGNKLCPTAFSTYQRWVICCSIYFNGFLANYNTFYKIEFDPIER